MSAASSTGPQALPVPGAPAPVGPYSPIVKAGAFVYISGQIALNPETGELVQTSLEAETRQVLANLQAMLSAAGLGWGSLVKVSIFLRDMADYATVNHLYAEALGAGPYPAREAVAVLGLPKDARVEISAIAYAG